MTPYYQDAWCTIWHGDCREILPTLPEVDLVLTDPPYGIGDSKSRKNNYLSHNDTPEELDDLVTYAIRPLIRDVPLVAVTPGQNNLWRYPQPTWVLCWATPAGTGICPWGFGCWQPIMVYGKDPYLSLGMGARPDLILHTETAQVNGHPCPKPIGLWRKVAERVYPKGEGPILDPFMGSGTTLRAAKDLNRKSIGIEIEEAYCEIAANRLAQEVFDFTGGA